MIWSRRNLAGHFSGQTRAPPQQQAQAAAPAQQRQGNAMRIGESAAPPAPQHAPWPGAGLGGQGALDGTRVAVGSAPILIGKGPATLQISDDPSVSTRHAQISASRWALFARI